MLDFKYIIKFKFNNLLVLIQLLFNQIKLKTMHILIGILIVAFIIGLVTRDKGDNFLDTLGSGCGTIIAIVVILGIIIFIASR